MEEINISDIKIGKRFRKEIGDITSLADSIERIGLLHPIVINEDNELIAGFRRIKALEKFGKKRIPYTRINIKNALQGEYDENTERKNFTITEVAEIYKEVEKTRNKGRPTTHDSLTELLNKDSDENVGNLPTFPKGPTDIVTGKIAGYSEQTINKIVELVEAAKENPELKEMVDKVDSGKTSFPYAYKSFKRSDDNTKERLPLPEGQYDVILADPPWSYDINIRGSPDEHYAVMTDEEIQELQIPAADNAVLFLWATAPKLKEALTTMEKWGFQYKTHAVWAKNHIGTGYWFRGQTEDLLVGIKGKGLGVPEEKDRHSSLIVADIGKHSKKPDIVYQIIESMFPRRKYLELFGRGTRWDESWTIWGNEASAT